MMWRIHQHPSESGDTDITPDDAKEQTTESIAAPLDPMAQLQADINAAKAEVAEWQDRFLRKAAELENYRKRAEKERAEAVVTAKSSVLIEFLPIADACERALGMLKETQSASMDVKQYQEGVELLYRQVLDALSRTGAIPIQVEGKQFDPHLHEALIREESSDAEEGTVVKELRRGYLFKDKLLRPAQVVVAVKPQEKGQTPQ